MTFRNEYEFGMGSGGFFLFEESGSGVKELSVGGKVRTKKDVCVCVHIRVCVCVCMHFIDRYTSKYVKERGKDTHSTERKIKDISKRG